MAERPFSIEDLAMKCGDNPFWNHRPVRILIGGNETVAVVKSELSDDPVTGEPCLLLTPDMFDMGAKQALQLARVMQENFNRRSEIHREVWDFLNFAAPPPRGRMATNRNDYAEILTLAFGGSWRSEKSDYLIFEIHRGMQNPEDRKKLQRAVEEFSRQN